MDRRTIENEAKRLHKEIWRQYKAVLQVPAVDPVWLLNPEHVARLLGFEFIECEDLGSFGNGRDHFVVAGCIDRPEKRICVSTSTRFTAHEIRFTGAHEVGHAVLHPHAARHRDRPLSRFGSSVNRRDAIESEADYFASCYLLPEKLVRERLERKFQVKGKLVVDENISYLLNPSDSEELLRDDDIGRRMRALAVASVERFCGVRSASLAGEFDVSPSVMAIRIEELGLVS